MRYLKTQSTNRRLLQGKALKFTQFQELIAESTGAFVMPKGSSAQRPATSEIGMVRYNTQTRVFEFYQDLGNGNADWTTIRLSEPTPITFQNAGGGNDIQIIFGPLDAYPSDPSAGYKQPTSINQILVMVENVLQIPGENVFLVENPCNTQTNQIEVVGDYGLDIGQSATGTGAFKIKRLNGVLQFTSWVNKGYHAGQTIVVTGSQNNNGTYTVEDVTPDYLVTTQALITEQNAALGNTFFVDGKSSTTGNSYQVGTAINPVVYVRFGSPPPVGKFVHVFHNFDK